MVRVSVVDTNGNNHQFEADKIDIKGDIIYIYDDEYKDNELAPTEKLVLKFVVKFIKLSLGYED